MNSSTTVVVGKSETGSLSVGGESPLALLCGPCVIESRDHVMRMAEAISTKASQLGLPLVFKSSYDKANRTSLSGFRGVGSDEGLRRLQEVQSSFGVPVLSDVHLPSEVAAASEVLDVLQIPAFLCRQTDLLVAAAKSGLPVMVKKGQFLHPADMKFAVEKIGESGNKSVLLCERGSVFGYRELVVDFRSLAIMAATGCPVVFDATHSVQIMGGSSGTSSGNREYVPMLARAAVACGVDALFLECHDDPENAPSDGPNMVPLSQLDDLLRDVKTLSELPLATRRVGAGG